MYSQKTIPLSQALLRSQNVPCSGRALTVAPTSPETTVQGALYRALLHLRALDNLYTSPLHVAVATDFSILSVITGLRAVPAVS